mmetsp:Transcript_16366/g.30992  ORF Transcript_16366/g.30992 Transcript_16366/m.30992 type:complete len:442 (+) Transcript_16366:143-1468(+)
MSYSCMNGRLRTLPITDNDTSSYISVTPFTLPQGLMTTHKVTPSLLSASCDDHDDDKGLNTQYQIMSLSSLGISETYRFMGKSIVDHCWTTTMLDAGRNSTTGRKVLVLAVLVRNRGGEGGGGIIEDLKSNDTSQVSLDVSSVIIQWRPCCDGGTSMGQTRRDTIDEQFPHKTIIPLPFLACSIVMNEHLLGIGTTVGVLFHALEHVVIIPQSCSTGNSSLLTLRYEDLATIKVMKTFVVHAMDISALHFVGVSGVRIGVWNVAHILKSLKDGDESCRATWNTTLDCKQRVTSVRICNVIGSRCIALCCWDGSAIVLRQVENSMQWMRVVNASNEDGMAPWEHSVEGCNDLSPCFLETLGFRENSFLVITTPSSSLLRVFDIDSGCEKSFGARDGKSIQGLVRTVTSTQEELIAYIDGSDMVNFLDAKGIQSYFNHQKDVR